MNRIQRAKVLLFFLLILAAGAFYGTFPEFFYYDGVLLKKHTVIFAAGILWGGLMIFGKNPFSDNTENSSDIRRIN